MPRNRMIKTDFWADEKIGKLSIPARLLYIGIWNFCDDSGVCRAAPSFLRSNIFPFDDITLKEVQGWITELSVNGRIELIESNGESYLKVIRFLDHQTINRPSTYRFIGTHGGLTEDSVPKEKEKENCKEKVKVNLKENSKGELQNSEDLSVSAQLRDCASFTEKSLISVSTSNKPVPKKLELNDERKKVIIKLSGDQGVIENVRTPNYCLLDDLHSIFWFNDKEEIRVAIS